MPETRPEPQSQSDQSALLGWINKAFVTIDDVILLLVAIGIIAVAILLLIEAATDFIDFSKHSISHIVSDLMFVLIIMELFRQVLRQINRHTFSLNPFIYIGVIASIRGILLTQMKLSVSERPNGRERRVTTAGTCGNSAGTGYQPVRLSQAPKTTGVDSRTGGRYLILKTADGPKDVLPACFSDSGIPVALSFSALNPASCVQDKR